MDNVELFLEMMEQLFNSQKHDSYFELTNGQTISTDVGYAADAIIIMKAQYAIWKEKYK